MSEEKEELPQRTSFSRLGKRLKKSLLDQMTELSDARDVVEAEVITFGLEVSEAQVASRVQKLQDAYLALKVAEALAQPLVKPEPVTRHPLELPKTMRASEWTCRGNGAKRR